MDYPGKVIRKTPVTPTQTSASGVWTLDDAIAATKTNTWPVAGVPNPISKSLRFNSADSAYLNRTPTTAGNRRTWTWSGWVKKSVIAGDYPPLFNASQSVPDVVLRFSNTDTINAILENGGGGNSQLVTTQVFRDPSAWYHIVWAVDTTQATADNRQRLYVNGVEVTAFSTRTNPSQNFDTQVNNTVEHRIGAQRYASYFNGYLTEINFIDGQALTPSSFGMTDPQTGAWEPIKYTGTYGTNGFYLNFSDNSSTSALGNDYSGNGNNWTANNFSVGTISSKVLEIVDATKSGSVTLSATVVGSGTVNLTAFGGCGNISGSVFTGISGYNGLISDWQTHTVYKNGSSLFTVQGGAVNNNSGTQTATQSRTAQTVTQTGISVVSGDVISITFGANNAVTPYYGYPNGAPSLTISASSGAFIADGSNNDSLTDVPTPWIAYNTTGDVGGVVRGNYSTLNPLWSNTITLSNGNLQGFGGSGGTGDVFSTSTIGMSSGKWYCEVLYAAKGGASALNVGIIERNTNQNYPDYGYYSNNGNKYNDLSSSAYGASWDVNDVIGISYDADVGTLVFYKNGVSQGTAFSGLSGTYFFCQARFGSDSHTTQWNFGQRPFAYTPPAGFRSLCTTNLPTPTIGATSTTQAGKYFGINLWTGNGSTGSRAITGLGFKPDWVWWKNRTTAKWNQVFDSNRGADKALSTNSTDAEDASGGYGGEGSVTSFDSDGYTLQGGVGNNELNSAIVGWAWQAGQGTNSSNTQGTITSTVSVNTTSGFSIVTYTGTGVAATVGHGLGVAPSMVIVKRRNGAVEWPVYHVSVGNNKYLYLNTTAAAATFAMWNNTTPTSTVFSIGVASDNNANTGTYVAYCFAAIAGYSAFGSFVANGSSDNAFIYTGFQPRFVMWKRSDGVNAWGVVDTARGTTNAIGPYLLANASDAEATATLVDILSNGFKMRNSGFGNGETYIYMAFAEFPFKFSNAR